MADEAAVLGDDTSDLLSRFQRWDKELEAHWGEWREETRTAFDFDAGRQWDKDDESKMAESGRVPVVFNRVKPMIRAVSGAEIQNKQVVSYSPRGMNLPDAQKIEVLNQGAEWIRNECDAEEEESEAFLDTLICGVGWCEMRLDDESGPEPMIVEDRVDPLEMWVDPSSRKANFADARYLRRDKPMSRECFDDLFPDAMGADRTHDADAPNPVVVDPRDRYNGDNNESVNANEVTVSEYQWFDTNTVHTLTDPLDGRAFDVPLDRFDPAAIQQLNAHRAGQGAPPVQHSAKRVRSYWRAFVSGGEILGEVEKIDAGEFTYKAMTGERDRNKGTFFGMMRAMFDPQRFSNKFYSQIMFILAANAKGGLMAERDAFEDEKQAEESWAQSDTITWMESGGAAKVQAKQPPAYPQGMDRLMNLAVDAIPATTGVNQEMLGMADRQQPGVLEHQRKEAAFGILAPYFKAARRFRRDMGRLQLTFMRLYAPNQVVQVVTADGQQQSVQLALDPTFDRFSVIVDDAPTGPNQKQRAFAMLSQPPFSNLLQLVAPTPAGPGIIADVLEFSDLPVQLITKLQQALQGMQPPPPDPNAQALDQAGKVAEVQVRQGEANLHQAHAEQAHADAQRTNLKTQIGDLS